jgi:general nucleoside transport system permease protein
MTESGLTVGAPPEAPRAATRFRLTWRVGLLALLAFLLLLSFVRVVSDANDLTSSGAIGAALAAAVPIAMAGLGGLWSERAGVVNIGLEGMMILGTWFGAYAAFNWGPWYGVLFGALGGVLGGLLHAIATVTFGVDHIVSGVAINILALGWTRYLSSLTFAKYKGGGDTQSPPLPTIGQVSLPGMDDPLSDLERKHWFFLSDLAGLLRGLTVNVSQLIVVAALLVVLSYFVLWRTAFGLRLRSCGENPVAAETLGVNVYFYKYAAVLVSGGLAGVGGAFLAIVSGNLYREGQTGGRGFIGLAAMIFGNWRPGGMAAGAGIFGYTDALQLRSGDTSIHALLLLIALLLFAFAAWQFSRRGRRWATVTAILGGVTLGTFLASDTVPGQFTSAAPHITTLLVLSLAAQRLRMPKADGLPYRRGGG